MTVPTSLQRDLEATIAHEVGHALVALSYGCEIHLAVERHPSGEHFEGEFWCRHPAGDLAPEKLRAIAVAGSIAQAAFLAGSPHDINAAEVFDDLLAGRLKLSQDDATLAEGYTLADVAFALDVVCGQWPTVEQEVAHMAPRILAGVALH